MDLRGIEQIMANIKATIHCKIKQEAITGFEIHMLTIAFQSILANFMEVKSNHLEHKRQEALPFSHIAHCTPGIPLRCLVVEFLVFPFIL